MYFLTRKWWDTLLDLGILRPIVSIIVGSYEQRSRKEVIKCNLLLALTVRQAFPCLSRLGDVEQGLQAESKIAQLIESAGLLMVGWYHSHPCSPPTPTVQDIESQLEYQLKLKGNGDQGYRPCIAFISGRVFVESRCYKLRVIILTDSCIYRQLRFTLETCP